MASTAASERAFTRSITSAVTPTAAATIRRPKASLLACGEMATRVISRKVINPISLLSLSTTGSFSILWAWSTSSACAIEMPSDAVIKFSEVITSISGLPSFFSKRKSRLVTIPINSPLSSTIGIPPIRYSLMILLASETNAVTGKVTGSIIIPDWERFTLRTLSA